MSEAPEINPPMAILAELTHRCPLACPYCSNPLDLKKASEELTTEQWIDVFAQAAKMGVLHLHLSGGEPASRRDLVDLTQAAHDHDLYINLITSGVGLTEKRMGEMDQAGLDHVQLSLQGADPAAADVVAGYKGGYDRKMQVAEWTNALGIPLTVNAVCHRQNMDTLDAMIDLAVSLKARRLEIATVQFNGWAVRNREQLMPTQEQAETTTRKVAESRERLKGVLVIDYVPADHHATYPKACMGGWGRIGINVDPTGLVLPCHAAETIPALTFDNVKDKPLADIWYQGQRIQRLSRHGLDAGAVPVLRPQTHRFRRLPLSGDGACGRSRGDRPRLHQVTASRDDSAGRRGVEQLRCTAKLYLSGTIRPDCSKNFRSSGVRGRFSES